MTLWSFCVVELLVAASLESADLRFVAVGNDFERLTGIPARPGGTARQLAPALAGAWVHVAHRAAVTGESASITQDVLGGGSRPVEVQASPLHAQTGLQVGLLFSDRSNQRPGESPHEAVATSGGSDPRFRMLADAAPAMLWVTEADGTCSYLSRGWHEYTGQSDPEGLGYGWLEAVHPADRGAARDAFLEANATRRPFDLEHRLRRADGAFRWVIDAGRPRVAPDGTFLGYVGSVIDIHDRKVAEERLDLAVDSAGVGLWYCDLPFDLLVWNRHVKEHFGLSADASVTIETFFDRLHPDDRESTRDAIARAIADRSTYDTQYRTVDAHGNVRWVRALGRAQYQDERPVRFDGITVDITELVTLRERSDAANRAKDEFLAMLGHELRNPLAPILTAVQLMKLRRVDAVEREREIIERQVMHVVRLVDDLLDVSRITSGRIQLEPRLLDLRDVVVKAIELASPVLEHQRHELRVHVASGVYVRGDLNRLTQVVTNLLTNAAKYTDAGGVIDVDVSAEGDTAVLRVTDSGVGIDAAMLPRIFDPFVQERQSIARSKGGLGLGLAIVRSLVELHGGAVSAVSGGVGAGSSFTVRIPRVDDANESGSTPVHSGDAVAVTPVRETRVLVVDDNVDAANLLGAVLRTLGYQECTVVHDGPAALTVLEHFRPQIALIDIGLPVMDGFELAERILRQFRPDRIALVAVTGYAQPRDREASARAGFAAHLAKPVDVDDLRAVLESLSF